MRTVQKLSALATGVSTLALVAVAVPASAQTPTMAHMPTIKQKKQMRAALEQQGNAVVDVATELDCSSHTLSAKITNKTGGNITPSVTFNGQPPAYPGSLPIEPGKTATYFYGFSGNHLVVNTEVAVDGQDTLKLAPTMNCEEPVSFNVSQTSSSAVTGYLQNNSSLVPQTVLTRVGTGDIHTETLQPGESRLVALPFKGMPGQKTSLVTIGTTSGFAGTYTVDLSSALPIPLPQIK